MKTRKTIVLAFFLCGMYAMYPSAEQEVAPPERGILLAAEDTVLAFGRTTRLKVNYQNGRDLPWTIRTPEESDTFWLRYWLAGSDGPPAGLSFGKAVPRSPAGLMVQFRSTGDPLTIPPRGSHGFWLSFGNDYWSGDFRPGLWDVWVHDAKEKMKSNVLRIPVRFTADSITACLERATAEDASADEKVWHAKWLKEIMPSLDARWGNQNTPPEAMAKIRAQRAKGFEEFRAFLKDPKNAEAIQAAIDRINREAGLPVEEEKPVTGGR